MAAYLRTYFNFLKSKAELCRSILLPQPLLLEAE